MKSAAIIILIFTVFTFAVSAQELVPATSEDQELFDQQLEQARAQPVKTSPAAARDRQSRFGSLIKEEASKLKGADTATRKQMGQRVSVQKRKNSGAGSAVTTGSSSSGNDGRNSAPGLNNSGSPGNSGNKKK